MELRAPILKDIVIFVHGTGAAFRDSDSPHWWQPISHFARRLSAFLGQSCCIGKPFRWSGANLESHRRDAGIRLLRRLRALDARGRQYHLIGHSHGGSVIWHALTQSAKGNKKPLIGLKTWTTVGTPFLEFTLDPTAWRYVGGLAISGAVLGLSWDKVAEAFTERSAIWNQGATWGVIATSLLFVILFGFFVSFFLRVSQYIWEYYQDLKLADAERKAAKWYGANWLGIWHPFDEPIAGLRASLADAPQLISPKSINSKSLLKRAIWFWYDLAVVPVTSQWAWGISMNRLQGDDLFSARLGYASSAPNSLRPGWAALPAGVAAPITSSADQKAAVAIAALRTKIKDLGDFAGATEAIGSLSSLMSWRELIHTSYFEYDSINKLIAGQVSESSNPNAQEPLDQWRRARPLANSPVTPHRKRRIAITIVEFARTIGTTALLGLAVATSYSTWISPLTERAQVDQIARATFGPGLSDVVESAEQAEAIVRLVALGKIPDLKQALSTLRGRGLSEERIVYALGFASRELPDLDIEESPVHPFHEFSPPSNNLDLGDNVRIRYASGLSLAGKPIPAGIAEKLADAQRYVSIQTLARTPDGPEIVTVPRRLVTRDYAMILEAAAISYVNGRTANAISLIDLVDDDQKRSNACANALDTSVRISIRGIAAIDAIADRCTDTDRRREMYFQAAVAAQRVGQFGTARQLFIMGAPVISDIYTSEELWHAVSILIDLDRIEDAVAWTDQLLQQWRNHPFRATNGRVVDLANRLQSKGKGEIAEKVVNEMLPVFMSTEGIVDSDYVDRLTEAAKILMSRGRRDDLVSLAQQVMSKNSKYFAPHLAAASILKIGGFDTKARDQLVAASDTTRTDSPSFELATNFFLMASRMGSLQLAARGIALAVQAIEQKTLEDRGKYYASLAALAAKDGKLYFARTLADRAADSKYVYEAYKEILESYLKKRDPKTWSAWGFSQPQSLWPPLKMLSESSRSSQ